MTYSSKKDVVVDIILNLEKPVKFSDVAEMFEEKTTMSITIQRVHQVVKDMAKDELVTIEKREENGNLVNYVRPKS